MNLLISLALLGACKDHADTASPRGPIADNSTPEGDPLWDGEQIFLYETYGTELYKEWPSASFMLQVLADEPEVFGEQFSKFGYLPDPYDDLPVGLKRGTQDPSLIKETCAMCHVAQLPDGRIWLGAPNGALDVGALRVALNERWVAAGNPAFLTDLEIEKARLLGPGRFNAESGDYEQVVPANFPVYYKLDERTALNYMGTGQNVYTEMCFAIFSFGAGSPNEEEALVPFPDDELIDTFEAFFGSLEAPEAPAQDATLVERGAQVFADASCGSCHHVGDVSLDGVTQGDWSDGGRERLPGEDPAYPRGSIRTSQLHRVLQDGDGEGGGVDEGLADLIAFIVSQELSVQPTDGYRVGPLLGLWTSAPYLHNGSVPTLDELLLPAAQRSSSFVLGDFTLDTTVKGNSNEGHEFGTELSAEDRAALVAYLLTL